MYGTGRICGPIRLNREIRRRLRVVGSFTDGNAALMLVSTRLRRLVKRGNHALLHILPRTSTRHSSCRAISENITRKSRGGEALPDL